MKSSKDIEWYDYTLPPELIRSNPLSVRHDAKLFVYDTKTDTITHTTFLRLDEFLPKETLLVLNESKVLPVRLFVTTAHGGKRELFLLLNEEKKSGLYPCLIKGASKVGDVLFVDEHISFEIQEVVGETRYGTFTGAEIEEILAKYGSVPLPHYIQSTLSNDEAKERYQTVFAKEGGERGSVAAPTASLHFTDEVFRRLRAKGVEEAKVTLHVGRGTFSPLTIEMFDAKKLHKEYYSIPTETERALLQAKESGRSVCAVGTTSMRTLESFARYGKKDGETDIFIVPPHAFTYATSMVTNFHLPKTSLMMLVQAFLEYKGAKKNIQELYRIAIENEYSFYSFGDSMVVL